MKSTIDLQHKVERHRINSLGLGLFALLGIAAFTAAMAATGTRAVITLHITDGNP